MVQKLFNSFASFYIFVIVVFVVVVFFASWEHGGGYGDKAAAGTGAKQLRYIKILTLDIQEYPDDPLPYYFLAHAHFDYYNSIPNKTKKIIIII